MEKTPNSGWWSVLPTDILRSVFECLSFVDFQRAKIVCSNWYSCSKQSLLPPKPAYPWLILFPEDGGCSLYNPKEGSIYGTMRDSSSGIQFLASSRNWFLVLDSMSNLYIMDVFSQKRFDLPPLESLKSEIFSLSRAGDKKFSERTNHSSVAYIQNTEDLRGRLWVDDKKEEYVVVWFFGMVVKYIAYCKNGDNHYRDVPTRMVVPSKLVGLTDILLHSGDSLYILTNDYFIRKLKFFGQVGFMDVSNYNTSLRNFTYNRIETRLSKNIAVTISGEILLVEKCYKRNYFWSFRLYKKDPNPFYHNSSVEVYSLGNEALLLDLGITVTAG